MSGKAVRRGAAAGGPQGEAEARAAGHLERAAGLPGLPGPVAAWLGSRALAAGRRAQGRGTGLPRGALRHLCAGCGAPQRVGGRGAGRKGPERAAWVAEAALGAKRARATRRRSPGPVRLQVWTCGICGTRKLRKQSLAGTQADQDAGR